VHGNGAEHYCSPARTWTCSAIVVRDPSTAPCSGHYAVAGPAILFDPHLLPLVWRARRALRLVMAQREDSRREQLLEYALACFPTSQPQA